MEMRYGFVTDISHRKMQSVRVDSARLILSFPDARTIRLFLSYYQDLIICRYLRYFCNQAMC